LHALKGATTSFTPLLWSSKQAALLDAQSVRFNPRPQDLMAQIEPTGVAYTIAARISGAAKTSFPAGPPLPPADAAKAGPEIKVSRGPINVIVMADTDIFGDRFWVRTENVFGKRIQAPFADNAAFILNAVENLTGSDDLITLRTRATNNRPFTLVQHMQAQAQAQFQQQADMLNQQMKDTEARLHALEQGGSATGEASNGTSLTPEQAAEIESFKRQLIETRAKLRDVQGNLRTDVDALGAFLAFVNIALVPLLVAGLAIVLAVLRRRRRARAIAH
jgi:ABC-type uncharacterized transport system involved in gliding motility auxiliary subunit